jgi:LysR family glycine cleavage system transcriptional activator
MVDRLPPLRALRTFEAAARHHSFRRAAEELNVTHSAVSHQIKALEQDLGLTLFRRGARSVALTSEGELFYPIVRDAFDRLVEGTARVRASGGGTVITLQVYVTFAVTWLMPRLTDFKRKNPDLQVRLITSYLDVDFDRDNVDMGVIMGRQRWSDLHYERLFTTEMFPVCGPEVMAGAHPLHTPADLAHHTLIHVDQALDEWGLWLDAAGVRGRVDERGPVVDNYLLALEEVIGGAGVALARRIFAERDIEAGRLVRPFALAVPEPGAWFLVYRKADRAQRKVERFQAWLKDQVATDPTVRDPR